MFVLRAKPNQLGAFLASSSSLFYCLDFTRGIFERFMNPTHKPFVRVFHPQYFPPRPGKTNRSTAFIKIVRSNRSTRKSINRNELIFIDNFIHGNQPHGKIEKNHSRKNQENKYLKLFALIYSVLKIRINDYLLSCRFAFDIRKYKHFRSIFPAPKKYYHPN